MNNVTTDGRLDWSALLRVPADANQMNRYALLPGDIVFNNTNSAELVGKSALIDELNEPIVYSNHFTRLRCTADTEPRYIAHWLQSAWRRKVFEHGCDRWVGQAGFQRKKLLALKIATPPLAEQRRIADLLDVAAGEQLSARRATTAIADDVDHLEAAAIKALLREPVSVEDDGEATPEGWHWRLLTNVARLESGHTPSRRHPEWWGGPVPWIALPDIRALDGREAFDTAETTNDAGLANSSARLLPAGTVVLSRTASVGFVTVMGRPMATSQDFVNWVCGPELLPWFLAYALIASRSRLRALSDGAIHKTIYMPTLRSLRVCLPSVAEQARVVAEIDALRATAAAGRQAANAQLAAIDDLPGTLLAAAFRGDL